MILKPKKPEYVVTSQRPTSLLPSFSKTTSKKIRSGDFGVTKIIPVYRFGFRHKYGTPELCHSIGNNISDA